MHNFERLGKVLVCLACCLACILSINPVFALSNTAPADTAPALPPVSLDVPVSNGHLVSYVRYSASYSSTIIGCMEDGTKVTVLGTKGKFYKIDCYDMNGYIAKSQVVKNDAGEYIVKAKEDSSESTRLGSHSMQETMKLKSEIVRISKKYIGVPYLLGGSTPRAFDCSGYTQYVYRQAGISINRTVNTQLRNGVIVAKEDLEPGDLVIFSNTGSRGFASHVGIYLGNGKLIHASESKGITIVDLDSSYFAKHYQCARRIILSDVSLAATIPTVGSITGSIGSGWRNEG